MMQSALIVDAVLLPAILGAAGVILGVVAMLLTRTVAMGIRARHIAHIGSGTAGRLLQPA